jgi:hypothetical protein
MKVTNSTRFSSASPLMSINMNTAFTFKTDDVGEWSGGE